MVSHLFSLVPLCSFSLSLSLSLSLSGKIVDVSVSADGMLLCTTADDKSLKVFDVLNFGEYPSSVA